MEFNTVARLMFTRIALIVIDKHEKNVTSVQTVKDLIELAYDAGDPDDVITDLYQYVKILEKPNAKRVPEGKGSYLRSALDHQVREVYGADYETVSFTDQLHFVDIGYRILGIGWVWYDVPNALLDFILLLKESISDVNRSLNDLQNYVEMRIKVIQSEIDWNNANNSKTEDQLDQIVDVKLLEEFYEDVMCPRYYQVDSHAIRWERHVAVGEDCWIHGFVSRGRAFILLTEVKEGASDFRPAPNYELVKYKGMGTFHLEFDDGIAEPPFTGAYTLYGEKQKYSMRSVKLGAGVE